MQKRIGIISDTHGFCDEKICAHLSGCDEIWHAGDVGDEQAWSMLEKVAPLRGVYGNIDGSPIRHMLPKEQVFTLEGGLKVYMIHIGGYPPSYTPALRKRLDELQPDVFICGHSHILKVIPDAARKLLHINPGAAGHHGFHHMRTLLLLDVEDGRPKSMQVVELGPRGRGL